MPPKRSYRGGGGSRKTGGARGKTNTGPAARPAASDPQGEGSADEGIQVEGSVLENLPNAMFKVQLQTGHEVLAHISGKIRMHFIKILPGDRVLVELSPYDLTRGRILYRYK